MPGAAIVGSGHPSRHAWAVGSKCSPTPLDHNLAIGVRAAVADHLGRAPTRAELTSARRAAHGLAAVGRAPVLHVRGADADGDSGDRTYLVLAKPNVIMNDIRIRGLAVAGQRLSRAAKSAQARCISSHIMRVVTHPRASIPNLRELVASSALVASRVRVPTPAGRVASPAGCRTVCAWVSAGWASGLRHEACYRAAGHAGVYPACGWRRGGWSRSMQHLADASLRRAAQLPPLPGCP
jgi:hypothetical protein